MDSPVRCRPYTRTLDGARLTAMRLCLATADLHPQRTRPPTRTATPATTTCLAPQLRADCLATQPPCSLADPLLLLLLLLPGHPTPSPAHSQALLGAVTTPTVGLVAVLTGVAAIIAADTGAYFVGRSLGRTKLTDISPKKTVEGAAGGMAAAVAVTLASWRLFAWPATPLAALVLGVRKRAGVGGGVLHEGRGHSVWAQENAEVAYEEGGKGCALGLEAGGWGEAGRLGQARHSRAAVSGREGGGCLHGRPFAVSLLLQPHPLPAPRCWCSSRRCSGTSSSPS